MDQRKPKTEQKNWTPETPGNLDSRVSPYIPEIIMVGFCILCHDNSGFIHLRHMEA